MTDQAVEPSKMESRDAEGKWLTGCNPNPTGNNGHNKGWQRYSDRVQRWLALPVEELRRIARSPDAVKKLSSIDAICLRHVVNSMTGLDVRGEREAMLDRIEGKPKQTTVHSNDPENPMPNKILIEYVNPDNPSEET